MNADLWNSLEIVKLLAAFLTPVTLAVFGIYVHRVTKRFEHLQWRSQKLIEKRLAIYDDIAPLLNDLLCYFSYVGCWKELEPTKVVSMKREIDKKVHLAAPLFSEPFYSECSKFQNLCFETYTGWGRDALLRTQFERRKQAFPKDWKDEWSDCFSSYVSDPTDIRNSYKRVMEIFASDIGVHPSFTIPQSGSIPCNIK